MGRDESARWILLSNYASLALGLVTAPLVARALGAAGRGQYAVILAIGPAVAIVAGMGVPWAARTYLGRDFVQPLHLIAPARRLSRYTIPPVAVVGFGLGHTVLGGIKPTLCVVLYMLAVGSAVVRTTYSSVLLFTRKWRKLALYAFSPSAISTIGVVILFAAHLLTVSNALLVNALALWSQVLWYRSPPPGPIHARRLLSAGVKAWPLQVAEILYIRTDQITLYLVLGSTIAGLYSVVALGVQLSFFLVSAMASPIFLLTKDSPLDVGEKTAQAISAASGALIPLWLAAWTLAPTLIPLVYGQDFARATSLIPAGAIFSMAVALWYLALHLTLLRGGLSPSLKCAVTIVPGFCVLIMLVSNRLIGIGPPVVLVGLAIVQGAIGLLILRRVHDVPLSALIPRPDLAARFFFTR